MQMAFFSIPARDDPVIQEDLNRFLRSHRVLTVDREFVGQGDNSFWALAVEYMEGPTPSGPGTTRHGKERVDYKEVLAPGAFSLFAKLRDWRKKVAEQDGLPVYAVLTNEQLAAIATKRPPSIAQLREVEGIGEAKAGKYGSAVLSLVASAVSVSNGTEPVPPGDRNGGTTSRLRQEATGGQPVSSGTETDGVETVPPPNHTP